jgi:protease-4
VALDGELEPRRSGLLDFGPAISPIVLRLDGLARNPTVSTVNLHIGRFDVGLASIDELRSAIAALRAAGKEVIAHIANADDKSYLVAAAAGKIRMDRVSTLHVDGFSVTVHYFADALAKLGVRFDSVEIGSHKSAPDVLTRSRPRDEDLEARQQMLDQAMAHLVHALKHDRALSDEAVAKVFDSGVFTASQAKAAGLVDELTGPVDSTAVPAARVSGMSIDAIVYPHRRWGPVPTIAVVPITGTIAMRSGDNPLPGVTAAAPAAIEALERAASDSDVVGVVVRVNSGGGDVYASELIWRAIRRVREVKPVVVSMGDVAASGGYYLAVAAPLVFAEANTITGSIGIFTVKPDVSGLLDLTGIHAHTYKAGEHADWNGWSHPLDPEERERLHRVLSEYYHTFIDRVATGRALSPERVRELAGGRVYTGEQALAVGLIDRLGGLADAVREVARQAGLGPDDQYEVDIPKQPISLAGLVDKLAAAPDLSLVDAFDDLVARVRALDRQPLALMPVHFEVGP